MRYSRFPKRDAPPVEDSGDCQDHVMRDVQDAVADKFKLTEEERKEMLPSGQTTVICEWAQPVLLAPDIV